MIKKSDLNNTRSIVYHISNKLYKDIRPLGLQDNYDSSKLVDAPYDKKYINEVSLFLSPITKDNVKDMRDNGFTTWGDGKLYLYVIDLDKQSKDTVSHVMLTSTPEQTVYDDTNWNKIMGSRKVINNLSAEEFKIRFTKYTEDRSKALEYSNKEVPLENLYTIDNDIWEDLTDMDKWVEYNIKFGSKEQYASYIPHLIVTVTKPLKIESVSRLI